MAKNNPYAFWGGSDRNQISKYPGWKYAAPNLRTFLSAINKSQPIIQAQFELKWNRWPRTIFFAKSLTIPGVSVNTVDLSHYGFTIPIPTHVTYETNEITMNILADKDGFHYYDLRNMVLQTGHPLVAGDPRATIGSQYFQDSTEDTLEIRLRNEPIKPSKSDSEQGKATEQNAYGPHHHWIIHNFHPIGIGDIELSVDGTQFVEFELKGTFTHITYDCGKKMSFEELQQSETDQTKDETQKNKNSTQLDSSSSEMYSSESQLASSSSGQLDSTSQST